WPSQSLSPENAGASFDRNVVRTTTIFEHETPCITAPGGPKMLPNDASLDAPAYSTVHPSSVVAFVVEKSSRPPQSPGFGVADAEVKVTLRATSTAGCDLPPMNRSAFGAKRSVDPSPRVSTGVDGPASVTSPVTTSGTSAGQLAERVTFPMTRTG